MTSKTWAVRRTPAAPLTRVEEASFHADDVDNNNDPSTTNGGSPPPGRKMGVARLPSIKEKRPRKPRASSFNDAITDSSSMSTSVPRRDSVNNNNANNTTGSNSNNGPPTPARRASIPQPQTSTIMAARRTSRPSFAGIGRRVSSLVKARMAFQTQRKSREENEVNHMAVIHELPRNARFTSFMSPEAQYAVLKGYEDKLYEKIANTSPPDAVPTLNRNKTPFRTKISFDEPTTPDNNSSRNTGDRGAGTSTPHSRTPDGESLAPTSSLNGRGSNTPAATRVINVNGTSDVSESLDNAAFSTSTPASSSSSTVALPSPFLKPLRRQSVDRNGNSITPPLPAGVAATNAGSLQRAHSMSSLPSTLPGASPRKRLVLTYRLESAMDILDTLNRRNKENALSPRVVRIQRKVDAVRDFNSWSEVWNKEFKEAKGK